MRGQPMVSGGRASSPCHPRAHSHLGVVRDEGLHGQLLKHVTPVLRGGDTGGSVGRRHASTLPAGQPVVAP